MLAAKKAFDEDAKTHEDDPDIPKGFRKYTLQELGPRLPLGIVENGVLLKDFSLRDLGYPEDKALGKYRADHENDAYQLVISKLLALMLTTLGGKKFEHAPGADVENEAKAIHRIGQCYMADVLYMYIYARVQELGTELVYPFVHENRGCNFKGRVKFDLNNMTVLVCEDPLALTQIVELRKGIRWRDGETKMSVTINPIPWHVMTTADSMEAQREQGLLNLLFLDHSVFVEVKGNDGKVAIAAPTSVELASLRKIDLNLIQRSMFDLNLGAQLVTEGKCEKCGGKIFQPIDVTYENFFGDSSLS